MSVEPSKRKGSPLDASQTFKRKKGSNNGKWTTPHQNRVKALAVQRGTVEPGDEGVWVTCARGMEGRAARELQHLFNDYAEKLYGIRPAEDAWQGTTDNVEEDGPSDIESLVQKELASLKSAAAAPDRVFTPIRLNVECLLFTKTRSPVNPVELAGRICRDAMQDATASDGTPVARTARYLNRLTPITASGRANERDAEEVATKVLRPWFKMVADRDGEAGSAGHAEEKPAHSFAIRLSSRHHNHLKRDDVIRLIASLIDEKHHKVDLNKPDKVILVDIFKTTLGMSVVDGDWNDLKKYNLFEIYNLSKKAQPSSADSGTDKPEAKSGKTDKAEKEQN